MNRSRRKKSIKINVPNKMIHFYECSFWYKDLYFITGEIDNTFTKLSGFTNVITIITLKDSTQFTVQRSKQNVISEINYQLTGIWR